jgi:transcriptional regulator with XRE-family HTH domain
VLKTLGDHLRKRRLDLGLRQSDLARQLGVWTSTVNTWENHHFDPEVQHVPNIVRFLGYDPFGPPPSGFAARLKAARIAAGLTRDRLAARLGIHPATVAKWERGEAQPTPALRRRLQAQLQVVADEKK